MKPLHIASRLTGLALTALVNTAAEADIATEPLSPFNPAEFA